MATPDQETDPETTDIYIDNGKSLHHDLNVDEPLRNKNEQMKSFELPERLLVPSKDDPEGDIHGNEFTELPARAGSTGIATREEEEKEEKEVEVVEDHGKTMEDFSSRERETLSSITDNHDSVTRPISEKGRLPNYRPTLILRSHKRGVAAVKFSPDGQKIASCCMSSSLDLEPVWTS